MSLENFKNNPDANLSNHPNFVSKDAGLTPEQLDEKYIIHPKHHTLASNITDFVPVVGSAKMIKEAISGEQMGTGNKIEGWRRAVHGVTGAAFLAADLTGIGAVGSIAGKALMRGGIKVGEKLVEKVAERQILNSGEKAMLKKEGSKLVTRGEVRMDKSEEIKQV